MSIKLMSKTWEMDIPQGQKMVLLALCDHANDDGTCFPSQDKIAKKCSTSEETIGRHVRWLKDHGILKTERRQVGRKRLSDLYIITLDGYVPDIGKQEPDNLQGSNLEGSNLPPHEPDNLTGCFIEEPSIEPSNNISAKKIAEQIKDKFNSILVDLPSIRFVEDKRIKLIRGRWKDLSKANDIDPKDINAMLNAFDCLFQYIHESDFINSRNGCKTSFGFDWIFKQENFIKILEGNYENKGAAA